MGAPKGFYVYHLIDPRDGAVFYVGKGSGERISDHEYEAKRGHIHPKSSRIREIIDAGLVVRKAFIREFTSEYAAYRLEKSEIRRIGLKNLTNLAPGGRDPYGYDVKVRDPDRELARSRVDVITYIFQRINWETKDVWLFGGKYHKLPSTFLEKTFRILRAIAYKYGDAFVQAATKKNKVIIQLQNKVECHG